MIITLF